VAHRPSSTAAGAEAVVLREGAVPERSILAALS
jgi:hypothetical protein